MDLIWEEGFTIKVEYENEAVVVAANRERMLSLANHLTALANEVPGSHIHLDEWNSLEDGSKELVIERME